MTGGFGRIAAIVRNRTRHAVSGIMAKRMVPVKFARPVVSFTFDDFPRSAYLEGSTILERYGGLGTYYTSLGLMNTTGDLGQHFTERDIHELLIAGHEIGCHTYRHSDAWGMTAEEYGASIEQNRKALEIIFPGYGFVSFSYPFGSVTPAVKRIAGQQFITARGIRVGINAGTADLNLLKAVPLYERLGLERVNEFISENLKRNGWLILYTHDVRPDYSHYGCSPAFFSSVVKRVSESGNRIATVGKTAHELTACESAVEQHDVVSAGKS
jgi:peptidoglycan/xylan/chitin deacetylase (PgdA/CDA1 family)